MRIDGDGEWMDWLEDDAPSQETVLAESEELESRRGLLKEAMSTLKTREQHILTERRLKEEPSTLEELAQTYDISRERVRQIEARAFEKLQKHIKELAVNEKLWPEQTVLGK